MALSDQDAQRQIEQMVSFILNEAREKAQEIEAKALQDFNIEKLKILQQMKENVRNDYIKKTKHLEVERSIARSAGISKARLKKILARDAAFQNVHKECLKKLSKLSNDKTSYKELCCNLIVEGALKLLEENVIVRCRKEDLQIIQGVLNEAASKFSNIIEKEVGQQRTVNFTIDSTHLPSGAQGDALGHSCCGGVVLLSSDKRIVCNNSLDERLKSAVEHCKPDIRKILFPS